MKKIALQFGLLSVALLSLLWLSKFIIFTRDGVNEVMIGVIAILLIGIGVYISRFFIKSEQKKEIDAAKINELKISQREYEVLTLINEGKSNQEIADLLFLSESTVKTHVSKLLMKLNANRRTEAVQKARALLII